MNPPEVKYWFEPIPTLDQLKVKYLSEQISPNGANYDMPTMEKHNAAVMSPHLQHLNTTINPQESPTIYIQFPPYTTCYHRTLEFNRKPQGVPNNIYPISPTHHLSPSNTYSSLSSEALPFWANLTISSGTKPAHWQYLPGGYPKETDPSPERPPPPP